MLRSKQQAILFLSGAFLVGGVVGYAADRVVGRYIDKQDVTTRIERVSWMDALGLSQDQRNRVEAILDSTNCRVLLLNTPLSPRIDSLRQAAREQWLAVLNADQRKQLDDRRRQDSVQRADAAARRGRASGNGREGEAGSRGRGYSGRGSGRGNSINPQFCRALLKEQTNP